MNHENKNTNYINIKVIIKNLIMSFLCLFFLFAISIPVFSAESQLSITKKKINKLKILEKKEINKMNKNQMKLEQTERQLDLSKERYSTATTKLETLEKEYDIALNDYNKVDVHVRKRIRQIYKTHTQGLVSLLLSSTDINDLLDKIYFQKIVGKRDKLTFQDAFMKAKVVASKKYSIEMQKSALEQSIASMNQQQKIVQKAIDENERYINKLQTDRATYEKAEKDLLKQSQRLENMISKTSKNDNYVSATGTFLKPINGPITSRYGYRIHPIFKSRTFHSGIDIGGPYGGPVKAANAGKVIYAGWYGGYGKVVIIDHGKYNGHPTTTLYAHLSSYNVAVGTPVVRGQVIGKEGSTGYSTGPHVHFEVRVNGKPQDPRKYI